MKVKLLISVSVSSVSQDLERLIKKVKLPS